MKLTRYFQSCLLVEDGSTRILIDPSGHEASDIKKFGRLDGVLYTHEHSDHFDANLAKTFIEEAIAPVYANESTAKLISASKTIVKGGDKFDVGGVEVKAYELPHCLMVNGSKGPQNIGYLIAGKLFHPGDGVEITGVRAEILAGPIAGPDVSLKDGYSLAISVGAKKVVPIHYDFIGTKPEVFAILSGNPPFEIVVLAGGESTEV